MSWKALRMGAPELAEFGEQRFAGGVAYLATVKSDGAPRVHPVTPIVAPDRLFLFMEPTSPKGHDLRRDGRYALHCAVDDSRFFTLALNEFLISGLVKDRRTSNRMVSSCASTCCICEATLPSMRIMSPMLVEGIPVRGAASSSSRKRLNGLPLTRCTSSPTNHP